MKKEQRSDYISAEGSKKIIKFPDIADKQTEKAEIELEKVSDLPEDKKLFEDKEMPEDEDLSEDKMVFEGENFSDEADYQEVDDAMMEDEENFYQQLRSAMEMEIQMYTQRGREEKPHQFSERYETRLKETLTRMYGEENAAEILAQRKRTTEELSMETTDELTPLPSSDRESETVKSFDVFQDKVETPAPFDNEELGAIQQREMHGYKKVRQHAGWFRKPWVKGAVACFSVLVIASVVTVSADALRVPIARFFSEEKADYTVLKAEPDTEIENVEESYPDTIEKKFVLGKVAEGYEEIEREEVSKLIKIYYQNSEGLRYLFIQETSDLNVWVDNEGVDLKKEKTVFGDAWYYKKDEKYHLVWNYEKYVFRIEGNLTEEEMTDLANSLKLEK